MNKNLSRIRGQIPLKKQHNRFDSPSTYLDSLNEKSQSLPKLQMQFIQAGLLDYNMKASLNKING